MTSDLTGGNPAADVGSTTIGHGKSDAIGSDPAELIALRRRLARHRTWFRWAMVVVFSVSISCAAISLVLLLGFTDESFFLSEPWGLLVDLVMLPSMLGVFSSVLLLMVPPKNIAWRSVSRSAAFAVLALAYAERQSLVLTAWQSRFPQAKPSKPSGRLKATLRFFLWQRRVVITDETWYSHQNGAVLLLRSRSTGESLICDISATAPSISVGQLWHWAQSLGITAMTWQGRTYAVDRFGMATLCAHAAGLGAVVQVGGPKHPVYRIDLTRLESLEVTAIGLGPGAASTAAPLSAMASAKSSTLAANVAATVAGTAVAVVMQIACLPMLIEALGLAAWGVLGLQAVVQGVVLTLDLGLGSVVGRELARLSQAMADAEHAPDKTAGSQREARNLVRTLEIGYWLLGALAAAAIWCAAPWLATHWVAQGAASAHEARTLPPDQVARSLRAMGIVAGMLLPGGLYTAVLAGLQRQIGAQVLRMLWSFVINVGAVIAVRMTGKGLDAFFAVQLATTLAWTLASAGLCWYRLPGAERPRWHPEAFARLWRFAAGMAVITVAGMVLVQIDKVALSYLVPLELAGGYFVAYTIGTTPLLLVKPLFAVIFPRLSRSVATEGADVSGDFHRNAQIMAALVLPLAAVVATFGVPLVQAWTRNADTAALAGPLAGLLIIGTALHALMHVPYALQLAHGWVRVSVHILAVVLAVMIPLMTVLVWRYSVTGAALGWLIMHALQLTLCVAATHGRLLPTERRRWLLWDVAIPLAVAVALAWAGKTVLTLAAPDLLAAGGNRLLAFAAMAVVGLVAQVGTIAACDQLLGAVRQRLGNRG